MLSLPSPQRRMLTAILGVAHELHLDAALAPSAAPNEAGTIYLYPAGLFDAVAALAYETRIDGSLQLTLYNGAGNCIDVLGDGSHNGRVYVEIGPDNGQRAVEAVCSQLAALVGVDPHIYAGPLRPRT
jgi:hypothetical protein